MTPNLFGGKDKMTIFVKNLFMGVFDKIGNFLGNVAPIFPLVGAAADLVSQSNTNKANARLAMYQNAWNYDMWQKQNDYNTPLAQMQRLKDAGLNPNMVYENGADNTAGSIAKAEVPHLQSYTGFSNAMSNVINSSLTSAQIKNLEEQNSILRTDATAKKLELVRNGLRYAGEIQDYGFERNMKRYASRLSDLAVVQAEQDYDRSLVDYDIRVAERNIMSVKEKMTDTEYQTLQAKLRTEMANADIREHESRDYEQLGIRPSDPLWSRAIANVLLQMFGKDKAQQLIKTILGI